MLARFLLCLVLVLPFGSPAFADPELHVVGIYEGFERSAGKVHGPRARVILDRPGVEVLLVLSSYGAVRWEVELGRDTRSPTVVIAQLAEDQRRSEVWIDGVELPEPTRMDLPLVYQPEGADFRELVRLVPERFGLPRMSSFSGAYSAPEIAFAVTEVVSDPRYEQDHLRSELRSAPLPPGLRRLLPPDEAAVVPEVRLTGEGFLTRTPDGREELKVLPLDMPGISWPQGAVRDPATGTLYGVTLGGDGYLFAYHEASDTWRVDRSMNGLDAQGLFLDESGRRLILTLGFIGPAAIAIIDLADEVGGPMQTVELEPALPGYSDLYDPGNGPAPALKPVGIDGDALLLIARQDDRFGGQTAGAEAPWRAYLVDLGTGAVDFVGYEGGIAGE